jgi:hypothetical protein
MTNLAVPSRSSYVADLQVGTSVQGTITISRKAITIEPVQSTVSESVSESTNSADSILPFPRLG